jgi:hypothetical protein
MKVFHGSTDIVEHPLILDTQRLLDFGKGFYTTTSAEQAEKWAILKRNRIGDGSKSFVTVYEIPEGVLENNAYKVKVFHDANEDWLDFVVHNRRDNKIHTFDIVKGAVANDTLYKTLTLYETGILTKQETIVRLKVHLLFDQISFHNQRAIKELKYDHFYMIE